MGKVAERAARVLTAAAGVLTLLLSVAVVASPAGANAVKAVRPTYGVRVVLRGTSLHHKYVRAGKWHSEPLTQPDDITALGGQLFTGFQNGVGPQGQASTDGNRDSTIVEFTPGGAVAAQWDIQGKCDGLTADPAAGLIIATVDEDANSSLYTIDPSSRQVAHYRYDKPLPHCGGTDAISIYRGQILVSASAPGTTGAAAPNPAYPALYAVTLDQAKRVAHVRPVFYDEARAVAVNGPHAGKPVTLGLADPDSSEVVPWSAPRFGGNFLLTSQGDKEQIYDWAAGSGHQYLQVLRLTQSVDDTAWATAWHGAFYATDHDGDAVDAIGGSFWPGTAFVAVTPCDAGNAPATCPAPGFPANYLGKLNMYTGQITPVSLRGPKLEPQGLIYVAS
jgi:hypothetical protein